MTQLAEIIIQKIKTEGPISFHDFMETALYYPELGYYSAQNNIGAAGDFYTSANLTPAFGAMLAHQLEEMDNLLQEKNFIIVEYGAGTGFLCHDILNYFKKNNPAFYERLHYCIIEKSAAMREKEKLHLHEKVSWYNNIADIKNITGCIFSNELLDNFAVHQVIMQEELMEIFVDYKNEFVEILQPAKKELQNYFAELKIELPKNFRTEINLDAIEWIKEIAENLKRGYVLTIDYGYSSSELYQAYRNKGTLLCYHQHRVNDNPYQFIGEQDITAHVNFSALYFWGLKNNLQGCGFTDQAHFLLALGFKHYLRQTKTPGEDYKNFKNEMFLSQTLLADMGNKYKVLAQGKEIPSQLLSGFNEV